MANYKVHGYLEKLNDEDKVKKTTKTVPKKTIKIAEESYDDLKILKNMEHIKYDYEIVQLFVDSYYNSLSPEDKRRFKVLKENM